MHVLCAYVLRLLSGMACLVKTGWEPCDVYRVLLGVGNKSI